MTELSDELKDPVKQPRQGGPQGKRKMSLPQNAKSTMCSDSKASRVAASYRKSAQRGLASWR